MDKSASLTAGGLPVDRIGPYRLTTLLGQGGMGVVYLAEQLEPVRREVALKILRAGVDSDEVIARFESERQALALMEHPNITRVYDAGTTESGLPYFVMERIVGVPITEYASAHQLTVRERVALAAQVCRAIQHAHQKGIIHRDIKPSNVLVAESDGVPVCKVIDFGIAKAIAPAAGNAKLAATGIAIGTPAYMSPEQFDGDGNDVDTRTDIYALGILAYELVAGVLPFDPKPGSSWQAFLARQGFVTTPAPSAQFGALQPPRRRWIAAERRTEPETLRRELAGDLDCIILKATEDDRERRYQTANAMVADLEHYLAFEPVTARPATAAYRMHRFVRRHRASVALAASLVLVLMAVAVGASIQARRLSVAHAIAVERQAQAENLISFMLGDLRDRLSPIGKLDLLDDVGKRALAYFAAVPASQLSDDEQFRRAEALQQLGDVRYQQGKLTEAAALLSQAIGLSRSLVARDSANPRWQRGLAHDEFYAGMVEWARGNFDSALVHFEPFVNGSGRLMAQYPESLSYHAEVAYALNDIGQARERKGDARAALRSYQAALKLLEPLVQRDSMNDEWMVTLAVLQNATAVAERKLGNFAGAERDHRVELATKQRLVARDSTNREWQRSVAIARTYLSEIAITEGKPDSALSELSMARSIYTSLVAHDPANVPWRIGLENNFRRTGQAMAEEGNAPGAVQQFDRARATVAAILPANADNTALQRDMSALGTATARVDLAQRKVADALRVLVLTIAADEAAIAKNPGDIERRRLLADAYIARGEALALARDTAATTATRRALVLVDSTARSTGETDWLTLQALALLDLGRVVDAKPVVDELLRRGYRRRSFIDRVRTAGMAVPR